MTKSPTVMVPATTPWAARIMIRVMPMAMITDWPVFSSDSEVRLLIEAFS